MYQWGGWTVERVLKHHMHLLYKEAKNEMHNTVLISKSLQLVLVIHCRYNFERCCKKLQFGAKS